MIRFRVLCFCLSLLITIAACDFGPQWSNTGQVLHNARETVDKASLSHRKSLVKEACTKKDISVSQRLYSSTGIPEYVVEIVNTCISSYAPSNIHLHCDWFASAKLVNPKIFKRLSYDDCLINDGKPLMANHMIRFTYANTFMYPISFRSAKFC